MTKSIAIIGGGIAGLSTGIYARMNGFETDIYEMHSISGGLCTAWKDHGFTFDGCLHWLTGSSPESEYNKLWQEIGAVQNRWFHNYDRYSQAMDKEGNIFNSWADIEKLRAEMIRLAPGDKKHIDRIIRDIRKLMKNDLPAEVRISNLLRTLRALRIIYKYRKPVRDLAAGFTNPVMRNLFLKSFDWGDMCSAFVLWTLALFAKGDGGYPLGGSLPFIQAVEKRYLDLGGRIHFHSKVEKIITEGNKAIGLILKDKGDIKADIVISAADGYSTIFEWLGGKYVSPSLQKIYNSYKPFPPLVFVSLGINGTYPDTPHNLNFDLKQPFRIGPDEIESLFFKNYTFDPSMAPPGKCVFTLMISTNFEYWKNLSENREAYLAEKKRVGEEVIKSLGQVFPDLPRKVEVVDVATPTTFVRYTGNFRGSYQGWLLDKKALSKQIPQILPGLENFYMAGQWVSAGGGLPSGLITGRNAIKKICKKEKVKFVTSRD
ncbi:MAG: NAD(P)/FAD-dependent oxidoreductase [Bacteroidetes bacterium]|nr:NAD(P)/FAD-dependent oxidoreductase [Bacteroidota bacterium]